MIVVPENSLSLMKNALGTADCSQLFSVHPELHGGTILSTDILWSSMSRVPISLPNQARSIILCVAGAVTIQPYHS